MELFQDYVHVPASQQTGVILRPYQFEFVKKLWDAYLKYNKFIACAATGSGKTKVFVSMADEAIHNGTVLILSESRKIFDQISEERETIEIKAGVKELVVKPHKIYLAMAQTLIRRPQFIDQFKLLGFRLLIIVDEAHVGTSTKILEKIPDAYLIGFTATPDGRIAKHLKKLYKGIVIGPQPAQLVEMGFLAKYRHFERKIVELDNLKKDFTGDFSEESQMIAFGKNQVFAGLLEDLSKQSFRKALIFCSSIKHCQQVTQDLRQSGYIVSEVHTANKMADIELMQFTDGPVTICVSVGILTKGFDFSEIDLVILQRATTSLALYCQMIGRGSRIAPGKERFSVLDYGGNASRHGLWNFPFDWGKLWNIEKRQKEGGLPAVKECPKCLLMVAASALSCPECGHIFKKQDIKPDELIGELVEVTDPMAGIRGKKMSQLTPAELLIYRNSTNKKAFALRVAKAKGGQFLSEYIRLGKFKPGIWRYIDTKEKLDFYDITIE